MYCPACGQQQISDEMRFCSRCGLPLSGLTEWLMAGARASHNEVAKTSLPSPRRKSIRRAAKLMFLSGVLFPVFLIVSIAADDPGPLIIPVILFFVSLVWMLYARLFLEKTSPIHAGQSQMSGVGPMSAGVALPPASTSRIQNVPGQRVKTKELVSPPSVTEHTTRLLDKD